MNAAEKVPPVTKAYRSRFVSVDGIRTHYLEAGEGPVVVLLHSGEFGGCAELSWEYLIPRLAEHYRVIAPDWLGFGQTAKIHDFDGKRARMIAHMARFLDVLAIDRASFVGNSMGATFLLQIAAERHPGFAIDRLVAISGGGWMPENEARRRLTHYDGSLDGMVGILQSLFEGSVWHSDEEYVRRRHALSIAPGAWEAVAAARFRSPNAPERKEFGQADATNYEAVGVPTLLIAGAEDKLRLPGYASEVAKRIAGGTVAVIPGCGHCANIERPDIVGELILDFLAGAAGQPVAA
ncbi:alpha/beta hydrolase [Sinorhizobium sp. RAC02]|uniref:alpha/beta fold hydrolase n=1 Tax=Sinorhizobium sp. RAC02 TaxID=1842534 RepID=UPI00083CECB0|nr:alpha/beta hydrolase [Sinorhizobium sp. RAC02]AOF93805.1 alpha/beta hydrolase family protein [Sinorhizobium sp. RAC02]